MISIACKALFPCLINVAICAGFEYGLFADPDSKSCTSECGGVTVLNVAQHVACRLQCVLPDYTGMRFDQDKMK